MGPTAVRPRLPARVRSLALAVGRNGGRDPAGTPVRRHRVRRRTDKDLGACARLLRVVHGESRYPVYWPERPRAWLRDGMHGAWVAERLGEVLGHVAVGDVDLDGVSRVRWREITGRDPADLAVVTRFFVRPRVRGQGVGTALLEVAVADIRARGLVPVLDVVSASQDAIRLFEDLGWRPLAVDHWGRPGDRLRRYFFAAPG